MRKFSFSNGVVDNYWNSLSAPCVNSGTINRFKKHVSVELEPETVNLILHCMSIGLSDIVCISIKLVGYIRLCLCLLKPLMSLTLTALVNLNIRDIVLGS